MEGERRDEEMKMKSLRPVPDLRSLEESSSSPLATARDSGGREKGRRDEVIAGQIYEDSKRREDKMTSER